MSAIYLSVFLAALDTVIVPTALPTITVDLDATDTGFAWIGATHMLSAATSLAIWNKISDIFGRKSVLLAAKIAFLAGSISSALCTRIAMLFVGRALQGVGGAGIIILGNRLIIDLFDEGNRAQYLAFSGVSWSLAMAVAPIVGGSFVQAGNWRWCFWSEWFRGQGPPEMVILRFDPSQPTRHRHHAPFDSYLPSSKSPKGTYCAWSESHRLVRHPHPHIWYNSRPPRSRNGRRSVPLAFSPYHITHPHRDLNSHSFRSCGMEDRTTTTLSLTNV